MHRCLNVQSKHPSVAGFAGVLLSYRLLHGRNALVFTVAVQVGPAVLTVDILHHRYQAFHAWMDMGDIDICNSSAADRDELKLPKLVLKKLKKGRDGEG